MRFSVSVVDGSNGREQVVLLDADPEHTVGDVVPQLLAAVGAGQMHPTFAARTAVWVNGDSVERASSLR